MVSVKKIVFLASTQPSIDRGWIITDAEKALRSIGYATSQVTIDSEDDIGKIKELEVGTVVWPNCFTIGPDPSSKLISEVLEELGVPFIGPSSRIAPLSSKLTFKSAVNAVGTFKTPEHILVDNDRLGVSEVKFPAMLKTEYSCNSEGVALIRSQENLNNKILNFRQIFSQRVFLERRLQGTEYTISFLPSTSESTALASALQMTVLSEAGYIDYEAKKDDTLIRLERPSPKVSDQLEEEVCRLNSALRIDCPFRVDVIVENDEIYFIELNLLPYLNHNQTAHSYFPMSVSKKAGMTYNSLISRVVATGRN